MTVLPISRVLLPIALAQFIGFSFAPAGAATPATAPAAATQPAFGVGRVDDIRHLPELSGLVPSHAHPGLFWGLNDSDNPPELFALTRAGHVVARVPVQGAPNVDWEDVATDERHRLYVSDMGNNTRHRNEVYVYRFDTEPDPDHPETAVRPSAHWTIHYPGQPFDCESLFVCKGYGYVMPKLRNFSPPTLYRFPLAETDKPVTLEAVGALPAVRGPITAADLSPDGRYLAVLTVLGPYVFRIDGDPARATGLAEPAGHATFVSIRNESACFVPDGLLTATEEGDLFLFTWADLGMKAPTSP